MNFFAIRNVKSFTHAETESKFLDNPVDNLPCARCSSTSGHNKYWSREDWTCWCPGYIALDVLYNLKIETGYLGGIMSIKL